MPRSAKRVRVERGLYRAGKTYIACATPPGSRRPKWKSLGEIGIMEARRLRDEFREQVRTGKAPERTHGLRFADVAQAWLEQQRVLVEVGELAPRTVENYEAAVRLHLVPLLGGRMVSTITADDLVAWHRTMQRTGAARWTIRGRWSALRGVLTYATRRGYIAQNPADLLTRRETPKLGEARVRVLSRDEMTRLLDATQPRYRPAIATALFTGMRVSELLGLAWAEVDFEAEEIRVRFQMPRDGKTVRERRALKTAAGRREIVLMPALASVLRAHRLVAPCSQDSDLVFGTHLGTTIGYYNLRNRAMNAATTRAGLSGVSFHALRHTFASILISQGRDVVFVSRQLGHANPNITLSTYAHLFEAARHAREARDELEGDFGAMLRGSSRGASSS